MRLALLLAPLALAGCITVYPPDGASDGGVTYARFGETVNVDGPRVTPLTLLEDSRCPANVQCVWPGRVRITARIVTGAGTTTRELISGQPVTLADGALTLVEVLPARSKDAAISPADYRFGFRFAGGL